MYVRVKNDSTGQTVMIPNLSKLDKIKKVKELVAEKMMVDVKRQTLVFLGKKLEDGFSLHDYSVKVNDVIQLMIRPAPLGESQADNTPEDVEQTKPEPEKMKKVEDVTSKYFKTGDQIDCQDADTGAWFEAVIKRITTNDEVQGVDNLTYHVVYEGYEEYMDILAKVKLEQLRPRAKQLLDFRDLDIRQKVMVNYNVKEPEERGFWYDANITNWQSTSKRRKMVVTVHGVEDTPDCEIKLLDECFKIEPVEYVTAKTLKNSIKAGGDKCTCKGDENKKCRKCGCRFCGGKDDPASQVMCDECDSAFHLRCLGMMRLPEEEEWFCPLCKNDDDIVGGSKKMAKKKVSDNQRDWGKGFACAGRSKVCDKVDRHHFGPIPGVGVGQSWLHRIQVSEEGVHRPPVGGIAGSKNSGGCQSIVLAGGYEDDVDNGDTFTYTGSGGRDLSGNKRTAEQSSDQTLDKQNLAIAMNCRASVDKNGGDAGDKWREGKPVRVVRTHKGQKHSEYAPKEGCRYDGIYKVVRYWPEKGKSGFIVWRYEFRRDDPEPAPWTKEGKKKIEEEGYQMIYPEGYLEAEAAKEKEMKRKLSQDSQDEEDEDDDKTPAAKKLKSSFKIGEDWIKLMDADQENKRLWEQVKTKEAGNKKELLDYVEELFRCIICQEIVFQPVTTPCHHTFCSSCMERSFLSSDKKQCSTCRQDLGEDFTKIVNKHLKDALNKMFPGYEAARK